MQAQPRGRKLVVSRCHSVWTFALLLAGSTLASAQEAVELKWKFEKDKPFFQEMITNTTQKITVMGQEPTQTQKQTFLFKWTPQSETDGKWTLKLTIEGVKMEIDVAGTPISYDSTDPAAAGAASGPLKEFFGALVGTEFTMTLDKNFKVDTIEGREEFLAKLGKNEEMKKQLDKILSDTSLKQMANPTFGMVPDSAKKPGDTWESKSTLDLGPIGTFDTTQEYKLVGMDDKNKDLAKIDVTGKVIYKAPADAGSREGLPFRINAADLKNTENKGTIEFNTKEGRLATAEFNVNLNGSVDVEIGGMKTKVELKQEQTTTIRTSNDSFMPKSS